MYVKYDLLKFNVNRKLQKLPKVLNITIILIQFRNFAWPWNKLIELQRSVALTKRKRNTAKHLFILSSDVSCFLWESEKNSNSYFLWNLFNALPVPISQVWSVKKSKMIQKYSLGLRFILRAVRTVKWVLIQYISLERFLFLFFVQSYIVSTTSHKSSNPLLNTVYKRSTPLNRFIQSELHFWVGLYPK